MNYKDDQAVEEYFNKSIKTELLDVKFCTRKIMYRFLSEVERITDERKISRRKLAEMVGTSPSFITQLFRGNKIVSLEFLSKLELALDFEFKIIARTEAEKLKEHLESEATRGTLDNKKWFDSYRVKTYFTSGNQKTVMQGSINTKYNSSSEDEYPHSKHKLQVVA